MSDPSLKVIIIGDSGVGKSALMNRCVLNKFYNRYKHTGVDFLVHRITVRHTSVKLVCWDTCGQEGFVHYDLPATYYNRTDCCVLVCDVNVLQSFHSLDNWRNEFLTRASPSAPGRFPFVVIGNKVDLGEENRKVPSEMTKDWCLRNGNIPYFETSAKEDINVQEAFQTVAQLGLARVSGLGESN